MRMAGTVSFHSSIVNTLPPTRATTQRLFAEAAARMTSRSRAFKDNGTLSPPAITTGSFQPGSQKVTGFFCAGPLGLRAASSIVMYLANLVVTGSGHDQDDVGRPGEAADLREVRAVGVEHGGAAAEVVRMPASADVRYGGLTLLLPRSPVFSASARWPTTAIVFVAALSSGRSGPSFRSRTMLFSATSRASAACSGAAASAGG